MLVDSFHLAVKILIVLVNEIYVTGENDCRNNNENSTRDHLIAVLLDISEYQIVGELGPVTNQDKAGYKTKYRPHHGKCYSL